MYALQRYFQEHMVKYALIDHHRYCVPYSPDAGYVQEGPVVRSAHSICIHETQLAHSICIHETQLEIHYGAAE